MNKWNVILLKDFYVNKHFFGYLRVLSYLPRHCWLFWWPCNAITTARLYFPSSKISNYYDHYNFGSEWAPPLLCHWSCTVLEYWSYGSFYCCSLWRLLNILENIMILKHYYYFSFPFWMKRLLFVCSALFTRDQLETWESSFIVLDSKQLSYQCSVVLW